MRQYLYYHPGGNGYYPHMQMSDNGLIGDLFWVYDTDRGCWIRTQEGSCSIHSLSRFIPEWEEL